jgi:hypothetical protein
MIRTTFVPSFTPPTTSTSTRLPSNLEDVTTRYRCGACGNLTRFDVVETVTTKAFHHFTVGGELTIEEPETVSRTVESVNCRWCGHGRDIEAVDAD